MKTAFAIAVSAVLASGCIVPQVIQPTRPDVSFSAFKTAGYVVRTTPTTEFGSNQRFSDDEISIFNTFLAQRLVSMGYAKPEPGQTPDMTIDVAVTESKEGSGAARFWVGMGAGRAVFTFDATFTDAQGKVFAAFQGGRSYTGMEFGHAFEGADDIKLAAATRGVNQIEQFILGNGALPNQPPQKPTKR